jgi:hypothetical protein
VLVDPLRTGGTTDGTVVFDLDDDAVSVNNDHRSRAIPVRDAPPPPEKPMTMPIGPQ